MDTFAVLNHNLEQIGVIDDPVSVIWAERYNERGEFTMELFSKWAWQPEVTPGYFLKHAGSDRVMEISDIQPKKDSEAEILTIKGYSGENRLYSRTTPGMVDCNGSVYAFVWDIMDENFINPTNPNRRIQNLVFKPNPDIRVTTPQWTNQFKAGYVYDIVKAACDSANLGFKWTITDTPSRRFEFSLYSGTNRSYEQKWVPRIAFSEEFDNIVSTDYLLATSGYKNVVLITSDDDSVDETLRNVFVYDEAYQEPSGYLRRELLFEDSKVVQSDEDHVYTNEELLAHLKAKGLIKLLEHRPIGVFDGKVDVSSQYVYGRDFYLGDLVQVKISGFGVKARVKEFVLSRNANDFNQYITLDFNV